MSIGPRDGGVDFVDVASFHLPVVHVDSGNILRIELNIPFGCCRLLLRYLYYFVCVCVCAMTVAVALSRSLGSKAVVSFKTTLDVADVATIAPVLQLAANNVSALAMRVRATVRVYFGAIPVPIRMEKEILLEADHAPKSDDPAFVLVRVSVTENTPQRLEVGVLAMVRSAMPMLAVRVPPLRAVVADVGGDGVPTEIAQVDTFPMTYALGWWPAEVDVEVLERHVHPIKRPLGALLGNTLARPQLMVTGAPDGADGRDACYLQALLATISIKQTVALVSIASRVSCVVFFLGVRTHLTR